MWLISQYFEKWCVGFYDNYEDWVTYERFETKEEAEKLCHYLNGGNKEQ